jgi:hypothetical protein
VLEKRRLWLPKLDPPLRGGPNTNEGMLRCTSLRRCECGSDGTGFRGAAAVVERALFRANIELVVGPGRNIAMAVVKEDRCSAEGVTLEVDCRAFSGTLVKHSGREARGVVWFVSMSCRCNKEVLCLTLVSGRN